MHTFAVKCNKDSKNTMGQGQFLRDMEGAGKIGYLHSGNETGLSIIHHMKKKNQLKIN